MTKSTHALALLAVAMVLAIAGCGGGDDGDNNSGANGGGGGESSEGLYGGGGAETNAETQSSPGGAASVSLASVPKLGMVLVDSKGFTLYLFAKDTGTTSTCNGACAQAWPPLTTEGAPQASGGASAELGTSKRGDGSVQVTYAGHPVYTYSADTQPGEANGNGLTAFGAVWSALDAEGGKAG